MNLETAIKEKVKGKKPNLWTRIFNSKKINKPQKVGVVYLRKNNTAELMVIDTKRGFFVVDGRTKHVERDCIYNVGKERLPLAIIEEEGLIPVGNGDFYKSFIDMSDFEKRCARHQDLALDAIRHAELVKMEGREGKSLTTKQIILYGLILLIGGIIAINYL